MKHTCFYSKFYPFTLLADVNPQYISLPSSHYCYDFPVSMVSKDLCAPHWIFEFFSKKPYLNSIRKPAKSHTAPEAIHAQGKATIMARIHQMANQTGASGNIFVQIAGRHVQKITREAAAFYR